MKMELCLQEALAEAKKTGELTLALFTLQDEIRGWKDLCTKIEIRVMAAVASEIKEDGKPKYSNETARQAEVAVRLENNETYNNYQTQIEDSTHTLNHKRLAVDESSTKVKIYRDYMHGGGALPTSIGE